VEVDHESLVRANTTAATAGRSRRRVEAVIEVGKDFDGLYVHPPQLMGSKLQPECLCEYYVFEVEEATKFLVRLGMLPAEAPSA
jgi:hypothetical protein